MEQKRHVQVVKERKVLHVVIAREDIANVMRVTEQENKDILENNNLRGLLTESPGLLSTY